MKAFVDTSTLFKKYHHEQGTDEFLLYLKEVEELVVAPTTYIELTNTLKRLHFERKLSLKDLDKVFNAINKDFAFFTVVSWNDGLQNECVNLLLNHRIKTLDLIQLAAAKVTKAKSFITSDQFLYNIAKKIHKGVVLI